MVVNLKEYGQSYRVRYHWRWNGINWILNPYEHLLCPYAQNWVQLPLSTSFSLPSSGKFNEKYGQSAFAGNACLSLESCRTPSLITFVSLRNGPHKDVHCLRLQGPFKCIRCWCSGPTPKSNAHFSYFRGPVTYTSVLSDPNAPWNVPTPLVSVDDASACVS